MRNNYYEKLVEAGTFRSAYEHCQKNSNGLQKELDELKAEYETYVKKDLKKK